MLFSFSTRRARSPRARRVGHMSMTRPFAHWRHALATLGLVFIASPAAPSAILPTYTNVGEPERAVVEAAISRWEDLLPGSLVFNVAIEASFLGGTLAFSSEFVEENGVPIGASITFDDGTSGTPWFIDETPFDDVEFRSGHNPFHGEAGGFGPAAEAFDLLTVMQHELGHALGFSMFYPSFAARVVDAPDGNRTYTGSTVTARLTGAGGGTHTLPEDHPFDLMNPELMLGHRLNPSPLNLALLHDAFGYDVSSAQPVQAVPEPPALILMGLAWLVGAKRFLAFPGSCRRGGMTTRVCVLHTQGRPASARAHGFPGQHRRSAP